MRLGIDASRATAEHRTGIENYSLHIIRGLLSLSASASSRVVNEVTLYFNRPPTPGLLPDTPNQRIRVMPFPRLWTHVRLSLEILVHRPDLLFVPGHVLPIIHPKRSVVTVHDLGYLYYPETYPSSTLRYLSWATAHNVRNSSHVIADSQATKDDILKHFEVPSNKVTVVHPGVGPEFQPVSNPVALEEIKRRYGITGEYFLYVGTLHPRKNVERLIQAYGIAKESGRIKATMVLAGQKGWLPDGVLRSLQEANGNVIMTGFFPQEDLPLMYSGATALVMPSLFEGFGMPVAEALACGTPVIASNTSSIPEVVGDAGLLVDPSAVEELAEAMAWVENRPDLREELRHRGLKRAERFSWERAAAETMAVLEEVAST